MNGNASTASMNLASTASIVPPKYPATSPMLTPATVAINVVLIPTNKEILAP